MKNEIKKNQYWEERGKGYCFYKGEDFYTITPIPYYFKRREILLKLLIKFFRNDSKKKFVILDVVMDGILVISKSFFLKINIMV